jgi:lipoprotein signal peptidase
MHALFIIFIVFDQITKLVFSNRDFLIFGLSFHQTRNYALPFNFDFGPVWNFVLLFIIYFVVGWFVIKIKDEHKMVMVGKAIFLAGAASNLADRLIYGYVRDFIDLQLGFVFNFADVFIVVGLLMIIFAPSKKQPLVENLSATSKT